MNMTMTPSTFPKMKDFRKGSLPPLKQDSKIITANGQLLKIDKTTPMKMSGKIKVPKEEYNTPLKNYKAKHGKMSAEKMKQ